MEQRIYRGNLTPEELADHLVNHFDPQNDLQAQKIGSGGSFVVQIGRGDVPKDIRHAVSLGISPAPDGPGVAVTMGRQQWISPGSATGAAALAMVSVMVTPWALFGLLWPLSDAIGRQSLPRDVWEVVDVFAGSRGAILAGTQELTHPHATPTA
jgi:hypothetical protein